MEKSDWEKWKVNDNDAETKIKSLDSGDIAILKNYGQGAYVKDLKAIEKEISEVQKRVNEKMGVKESDTGLALPNLWDLQADKVRMGSEHPLQVARVTKIIKPIKRDDPTKYVINAKQTAKFVVGLGDKGKAEQSVLK